MDLAYRGATLLDGTGAPAREGMTILVSGEEIRLVAPDADVPPAELARAEVVDVAGLHVIPGLIDSHQHIATPPDRPLAEAALRRDLYGGVTATRDMADDLRQVGDLARAALVGEIEAPDIHYAALMAGPSFFTDPRTWQVSQGATPGEVPWMQAISPSTDLPLAVAMARGTFATAIKIYADLPGATVAAITAEAHRQGIAVWAHAAVFPATPAEVIASGVDAVSHVHLLAYETAERALTTYQDKPPLDYPRLNSGDDAQVGELFDQMRRQGTVLDATGSLWARFAREAKASGDDEAFARATANEELSAALTLQAFRAGVTVSAGTDCDPELSDPWPPLYEELDFLVKRCGLTPEHALRCASWAGALSMGAQDRMGTIEPGKLANFMVLMEDPTRDLAALRSVVSVVKRGLRYERAEFRQSALAPGIGFPIVNALGGLENPNAETESAAQLQQTSEEMVIDDRALADAQASGLTAVNITLGYTLGDLPPYEHTMYELDVWDGIIAANTAQLLHVRKADDIRRAYAERRVGVIYGFQNAVAVGEDRALIGERIGEFADRGVRVVQLTYNQANHLGDGSMAAENRGLTAFGRDVVESLNEHRLMVDLSHSGERTCLDAVRASAQPISINHTGCRALTDLPRNKTDEELRLVAERGGFVGVYFMPFLAPDGHARAKDVVEHLVHAVNVCGEDAVGIGTDGSVTAIDDLDAYRATLAEHVAERARAGVGAAGERADTFPFVVDLRGKDQFRELMRLLEQRGWREERIAKVMGGNFISYAERVWAA